MNKLLQSIKLAFESILYAKYGRISTIKSTDYIYGDIYSTRHLFSDETFTPFLETVVEFLHLEKESPQWNAIGTVEDYIMWIKNLFSSKSKKEIVRAFDLAMLINFDCSCFHFNKQFPYHCAKLIAVKREIRYWLRQTSHYLLNNDLEININILQYQVRSTQDT